jgi:hypothetical protein
MSVVVEREVTDAISSSLLLLVEMTEAPGLTSNLLHVPQWRVIMGSRATREGNGAVTAVDPPPATGKSSVSKLNDGFHDSLSVLLMPVDDGVGRLLLSRRDEEDAPKDEANTLPLPVNEARSPAPDDVSLPNCAFNC